MNEEKKEGINNNQMDIFTKGFVKPPSFEEVVDIIEIEEDMEEEPQTLNNQEFKNDIKYNNVQMKEKAQKLIKELEEDEEARNNRLNKKRRRKNLLLVIGIMIEIGIIAFLCYIKFFKETYSTKLTCTNTSQNSDNYTITMNNVYYFDKENKVAKTENSIIYIFNDKKSYEKYKADYIDTNIKNYQGIEQIDIFDDQNYAYENKTTYTYSKLKKNKNVSLKNNLMTIKIKNKKEPITIFIEDYDDVIKNNEKIGFICE